MSSLKKGQRLGNAMFNYSGHTIYSEYSKVMAFGNHWSRIPAGVKIPGKSEVK